MKTLLVALLALFVATPLVAQTASPPVGTPGVQDGDCWKNSSDTFTMEVEGKLSGAQDITATNGDDTGSTEEGTPDPDGGCADSGTFKCGTTTLRVKRGKMQFKNSSDRWVTMTKVDCPPDNLSGPGPDIDGDELGSLPRHGPPIVGMSSGWGTSWSAAHVPGVPPSPPVRKPRLSPRPLPFL